jgi:EmrB/QacA subfamily drug resistance transporter
LEILRFLIFCLKVSVEMLRRAKTPEGNCQNRLQNIQAPAGKTNATVIFGLVIAAAFLDIVDFSIIQIALPTIREQFAISLPDSQWIVGSYGLTLAGFLLLSGRMGDLYGQKKLFIIGVAVFTVASFTAGFAPSLLSLVISRAVQGVGAAISTVTALAIFATIFPEGPQRNRALGILVAVLSAGFAAGSITGGVLTAAFGWRSVMFVNVPIGAATVLLSFKFLPQTQGRCIDKRLDIPGSLTVTLGTILFVYALTNAGNEGFATLGTLLPLGISILLLVGFLVIESRSKAPLMPLGFLRRGTVLTANILTLIVGGASGGLGFIITIYLQQVLGYSALATGLAFLPSAVVFLVVGGWGSSRLVDRFGVKPVLLVALSLIVVGNILLTFISTTANFLVVEPGSILWAFGASIGFPALYIVALSGIKPGEEGLASGVITTSQRVGFPLGLALLVTVASTVSLQPMGSPSASTELIVLGFRYAFIAAAIISAIGLLIAIRIRSDKLKQNPQVITVS